MVKLLPADRSRSYRSFLIPDRALTLPSPGVPGEGEDDGGAHPCAKSLPRQLDAHHLEFLSALRVGAERFQRLRVRTGDRFDLADDGGLLRDGAVVVVLPRERLAVAGELALAVHDAGDVVVDPRGDEGLRDVVEAVEPVAVVGAHARHL